MQYLNNNIKYQLSKYLYHKFPKIFAILFELNKSFYPIILYLLKNQRYVINKYHIINMLEYSNNITTADYLEYSLVFDNLLLFKSLNVTALSMNDYYLILSTEDGNISRHLGDLPYDTFFNQYHFFNNIYYGNYVDLNKLNLQSFASFIRKYKSYSDYSQLIAVLVTSGIELNQYSKQLLKDLMNFNSPIGDEDCNSEIEQIIDNEASYDTSVVRDILNSQIFKYFVLNLIPIDEYYQYINMAIKYNAYDLALELLYKYKENNNYNESLSNIVEMYNEYDEKEDEKIRKIVEILAKRNSNNNYDDIIEIYTNYGADDLVDILKKY